MAQSKSCS